MQVSKLLQNDDSRAVSPVIGVILMVAITVILAAVIGTFVLGLGDQIQETTPNAQINLQVDSTAGAGTETVTAIHNGGDSFHDDNSDDLFVSVDGTSVAFDGNDVSSDTFSAGSQWTTEDTTISGGENVQLVWEGDSDRSAVIQTTEA